MPAISCPSRYYLLEQECLSDEKPIKFYIVFHSNIVNSLYKCSFKNIATNNMKFY